MLKFPSIKKESTAYKKDGWPTNYTYNNTFQAIFNDVGVSSIGREFISAPQLLRDGQVDIVWVPGFVSNVEYDGGALRPARTFADLCPSPA